MTPMKVEDVKEGTDYTFLFEFKNNSSTASTNGARVYIVQRNNSQFWGSTISANLEGPNHNSSIYLAEVDTSNGI